MINQYILHGNARLFKRYGRQGKCFYKELNAGISNAGVFKVHMAFMIIYSHP